MNADEFWKEYDKTKKMLDSSQGRLPNGGRLYFDGEKLVNSADWISCWEGFISENMLNQ